MAIVITADQLSNGVEATKGAHGMAVVLIKGKLHEGSHCRTWVPVHVIFQQWSSASTGPFKALIQVVRIVTDLFQQPQYPADVC